MDSFLNPNLPQRLRLAVASNPLSPSAPGEAQSENAPRVRCECRVCGAHAYAEAEGFRSGRCGNCGSYDLTPLQ